MSTYGGRIVSAVLAAVLAAAGPLAGQQPEHTVRGRIVEIGTGTAVSGAVVVLGDVGQRISGADGRFAFDRVPRGRYTLRTRMLGYRADERVLDVRADTVVRIEIDIEPIRLDTLAVEVRDITLRGRVTDAETGRSVFRAEVLVPPDHRETTAVAGGFRIRDVQASGPVPVEVRAFGYLPARAIVAADRDTTLVFELEEDPLIRRAIEHHLERMEERASEEGMTAVRIDREELLDWSAWTADALVFDRLPRWRGVSCVFVDEREVDPFIGFREYLQTYVAKEIQHIEILRAPSGPTMVRVYTREFMRRLVGGVEDLPPIMAVATPGGTLCR